MRMNRWNFIKRSPAGGNAIIVKDLFERLLQLVNVISGKTDSANHDRFVLPKITDRGILVGVRFLDDLPAEDFVDGLDRRFPFHAGDLVHSTLKAPPQGVELRNLVGNRSEEHTSELQSLMSIS